MMDAETVRFIRNEIRSALQIILSGSAGDNDSISETINELFPGMPGIPARPLMHPYGLVSRAPDGTIQVTARHGEDKGNRVVLGHRDKNRPSDINKGETAIYDQFGHQIRAVQQGVRVRASDIRLGSDGSPNPLVLGDIEQELWRKVIAAIRNVLNDGQIGFCPIGPVYLDPSIDLKLQQLQQEYVDDPSTNIVSQVTFSERGGS